MRQCLLSEISLGGRGSSMVLPTAHVTWRSYGCYLGWLDEPKDWQSAGNIEMKET